MTEASSTSRSKSRDEIQASFIEAFSRTKSDKDDFVNLIADQRHPSTHRNQQRREAFFTTPFHLCIERARYYTQSNKETEGQPQVLRQAKAFNHYLTNVTTPLHDHDLFAGYAGGKMQCSQIFPELDANYLDDDVWDEARNFKVNPISISDDEIAELKEIAPYWRGKTLRDFFEQEKPEENDDHHLHGLYFANNMLVGIGHMIVDVERVLKHGLKSIRDDALAKIEQSPSGSLKDINEEQRHFYEAVVFAIDGVIAYAQRNASHAEQLAKHTTDPLRHQELMRMAEACRQVPEHPARNFYEALQCTLLLLVCHQMESCDISICPGRMDQYLYPFYEKEIESGDLGASGVLELIENFLIRLGHSSWLFYGRKLGQLDGYNLLFSPARGNLVTVTLSGKDNNQQDLTNELTYLILHAHANNRLGFPNLAVRLHENSPDKLWEACARVIGTGKGQPAVMNDEVMIPALKRLGFTEEDAHNYADIGCIEMGAAGKSVGPVSIGFVNLAKCLDLALHNGKCSIWGDQVGPETGDTISFTRYEQLLDAYAEQVRFAVAGFNQSVSAIERGHQQLRPIPFQSSITDNAMELGLDLTNGGSKYYTAGIEGVGMADVADSLAAVKKLVFEDETITLAELLEALSANFEGQEKLRQLLLNTAPKFGNDDDEADEVARESCTIFLKEVKNHTDHWGSVYYPGIWSIYMAVELGVMVGALPSGRLNGEPMAEGVAPSRGRDKIGPTATVNSVAKLDHHLMENGSIFNMRFNPTAFEEKNLPRFTAVQKAFFDQGGFQMQVAVVDKKTLLDAQKHPENHRNLVVRIAGYCAQFTEIGPRMQEHIIQRTEHN